MNQQLRGPPTLLVRGSGAEIRTLPRGCSLGAVGLAEGSSKPLRMLYSTMVLFVVRDCRAAVSPRGAGHREGSSVHYQRR